MRKIITISLVFFCSYAETKAQTFEQTLLNIDYRYYLGKPIDSLLAVLPQPYDSMFTASVGSMFWGAKIIISYQSSQYHVYLCPSTNNYFVRSKQPGIANAQAWPLANVKKELLESVEIRSANEIYPIKEVY